MNALSSHSKPPFSLKKASLTTLLYLGIFLLVYTGINHVRKPVMPVNSSLIFNSIDGKTLNLTNMSADKAVLVYFWGTWCGVCRQTTPIMDSLSSNYPVVSVAVQSDDNGELASYAKQHQLNFAVINDNKGEIFQAWQGQVTPSYAIVSHGKVVQAFTGIQPAWVLKMRMTWADGFG